MDEHAAILLSPARNLGRAHLAHRDSNVRGPARFSADTGAGIGTMQLDPALSIGIAAAEPQVQDPVAICWDAAGAMYVAEMGDYPHSPPEAGSSGWSMPMVMDVMKQRRCSPPILPTPQESCRIATGCW